MMGAKKKILSLLLSMLLLMNLFVVSADAGESRSATAAIWDTLGTMVEQALESFDYEDVMTIYISGIDTPGDMVEKSDSDVNILITVNTKTKQVLLVNTPRDYYVPLSVAEDAYDALTFAGNYGVDTSIDCMEKIYDVNVDYYLRFNFNGFVDIINALGGVNVYSDYEFDAGEMHEFHFQKGENLMNGEAALAFVRENAAFSEGEHQRGKNQLHVIEGVVKKLASTDLLSHADELLSSLSGAYETDIAYGKLLQFGINEYPYLGKYQVETFSVNGSYADRWSYSREEDISVMIPDESTVEDAKARMVRVRGEN